LDVPHPDGLVPTVSDRSRSGEQQGEDSRGAENREPVLEPFIHDGTFAIWWEQCDARAAHSELPASEWLPNVR
jgi:hypothetical protein